MHSTDASLLLRLKQPRAEVAWRRFVELYTPLLFFWARQVGLQAPDDADFVQDVFAALVRKLPEFEYDPGRSFRGWLRTVVLNQWRDQRRRKAAALPSGAQADIDLADVPDPRVDQAFWEHEHRQQLVTRALTLMKAEFEEATWRSCWECVVLGRAVDEVAAELGVSRNAVYIAKCRVLQKLRQELWGMLD